MLKDLRPINDLQKLCCTIFGTTPKEEGAASGKMSKSPLSLLFELMFYIVIEWAFNLTFCFRNHLRIDFSNEVCRENTMLHCQWKLWFRTFHSLSLTSQPEHKHFSNLENLWCSPSGFTGRTTQLRQSDEVRGRTGLVDLRIRKWVSFRLRSGACMRLHVTDDSTASSHVFYSCYFLGVQKIKSLKLTSHLLQLT